MTTKIIKILIGFSVIGVVLICGWFMMNQAPAELTERSVETGSAIDGLQLTIKSDREVYKVGEEIKIELILENISEEEIVVCTVWLPSLNMEFKVTRDGEKIEPIVIIYELAPLKREDYVKLKPGENIIKSFDISKYVPIDKSGNYNIKVSYNNWYNWYYDESEGELGDKISIDAWTGTLTSNSITIEVIDKKRTPSLTLDEAKEIGKRELKRRGYPVEDMRVEADEKNTAWQEFVAKEPSILQRQIVKRLNLEEKNYWAIYYAPKEAYLGGDAWVFVDADNGEIIGVIFGE